MMVQLVDTVAFSGAAAAAGWALWSSVAPQWDRVLRIAAGRPDPTTAPLARLARAERRITARAYVSSARPAPASVAAMWREAA